MLGDKDTKNRALARVRLAEGIGQHYRFANPHNRRKLPTLMVGKVYPGKGQGKARGGGVPNATKPGQLKKSEREALGRLQVVRVQPELALGSLADWLQAPWPLEKGRSQSGKSPRSQVGYSWGSTFPHLTPGLHGRKRLPANTGTHAMSCLHSIFPHPPPVPHQSPGRPCPRHKTVTSGVPEEGAGGSLNSQHRLQTAAHPIPHPARAGWG